MNSHRSTSVIEALPHDTADEEFWDLDGSLPILLLRGFRNDLGLLVEGEPLRVLRLFGSQLGQELRVFVVHSVNPWVRKSENRLPFVSAGGFPPPPEGSDFAPPPDDAEDDEDSELRKLIGDIEVGGERKGYPYVLPELERAYEIVRENRSKNLRTLLIFDSIDGLADFYGLPADHYGPPAARLILAIQNDLVARKRASAVYILEKPAEKRLEALCDGKILRFSINVRGSRTRNLMTLDGFAERGAGSGRRFFSFQLEDDRIVVFDMERIVQESFDRISVLAGRVCDLCGTPLRWMPARARWKCPRCRTEIGPHDCQSSHR